MKTYEYMVLEFITLNHENTIIELNECGTEGWELVFVIKQIPRSITAERDLYYFKREK